MKKLIGIIILITALLSPITARADVTIHDFEPSLPGTLGAQSAIIIDQVTGEVLYAKNSYSKWIPASLTKLVTAQVVLDLKPKMTKICTMSSKDEVGGARLSTYAGAKYRLQDLLNASLVASANNATSALAHCTGLTDAQFIAKMNAKAKQLGAINTSFVETTGMDIANTTTANDMAKIANAAFSTKIIRDIAQKKTFTMTTQGSSPKRTHNLKTTNALLADASVHALAGKTGYLDESLYNFAGSFKNADGKFIITVILGSPAKAQSFTETKVLVKLASDKVLWKNFTVSSR